MKVKVKRTERVLHLCDWKSGKYKDLRYQDFNQLLFYAIHFFEKYNVPKIIISFIYVEHNLENSIELNLDNLDRYKRELLINIKKIEDDTVFNKKITKLCDYCGFQPICE